ncbi:MAG TPA: metal ABC transporter substrate-binding protein [Planctomycetota bacterium]|nr:metal ABC transporter substrate-binding protein [Planctomycetota bacterium]
MKRLALLLLAAALLARADETSLNVLASTTDLADIVRVVGGDRVDVSSLCKGPEDPHFLDARPSFLRLANRADMVVVIGMELEVGYMPLILRDCANADVRPGGRGYVDASARIRKLQVPAGGAPSRAHGDVHALGNPHYLMDPANAVIVAEDVARALGELRPARAKEFESRAAAFRDKVKELLLGKEDASGSRKDGLLDRFRPYKGAPIISYHDDMPYLAARLGLEVAGTIESRPGVPPTASHLKDLREVAKGRGVRVVLYEVFEPEAPVQAFCGETGARAVLVAHQPGAFEDAPDLLAMYRRNADAILAALKGDRS